MNHLTTYEQMVADKLQQLPVPDMADAIWARIERQLDVEMPVDKPGNPNNGNNSLPGFRFPGNMIFYIFIAALVSIIFYFNRPVKNSSTSVVPTSNAIVVPATSADAQKKFSPGNKQVEIIYRDKADIPIEYANENTETEKEQSVVANPIIEAKENEIVKKTESPPLIETIQKKSALLLQDSVPKKSRGVKGITTSDYRIAPVRKDSL